MKKYERSRIPMFGFSMTKMIRAHSNKLDKNLRDSMLHLYKPFKWTPCFLHKFLEGMIKSSKKLSVIVEMDSSCYDEAYNEMDNVVKKHYRCKMKKQFKSISCCSMEIVWQGRILLYQERPWRRLSVQGLLC